MFDGEAVSTNFEVFGMTNSEIETMTSHSRQACYQETANSEIETMTSHTQGKRATKRPP